MKGNIPINFLAQWMSLLFSVRGDKKAFQGPSSRNIVRLLSFQKMVVRADI
jgi:hypothetical protein